MTSAVSLSCKQHCALTLYITVFCGIWRLGSFWVQHYCLKYKSQVSVTIFRCYVNVAWSSNTWQNLPAKPLSQWADLAWSKISRSIKSSKSKRNNTKQLASELILFISPTAEDYCPAKITTTKIFVEDVRHHRWSNVKPVWTDLRPSKSSADRQQTLGIKPVL